MRRTWVQAVTVGLVSTVLLVILERIVAATSSTLYNGYLFQPWSSNDFMQEVKINDLINEGPSGLWWLHVQPPGLESMRFALAVPEWLSGATLTSQGIDERMYLAYAVLFGVLSATALFALYPGTLAMATLLDGTFLSATLVTVMLLLLYLTIRTGSATWLNWWLVALLVVSMTRTIFQLQILILIPLVVWAMYRTRITVRTTTAIVVSVVLLGSLFLLPLKQFVLYDTTATTTFAGNHQIEVVSYRPTQAELDAVQVPPEILDTAQEFVSGFNSPENVRLNYVLSQVGNKYYLSHPAQVAKNLVWGFQMNLAQAFKFTHEYSSRDGVQANRFVAALPWTPPMVNGLSVAFYLLVLLLTLGSLLYARGWRGLLRLAWRYWPLLFVVGATMLTFLLANRYDWSEADRLKFIVEPFFAVVFVASLHEAWTARQRGSLAANSPPVDSRSL
jgi:hypothetical protein